MSNEFWGCAKVLSFRAGAPLCTGFVHRSRGGTSSIALYPTHGNAALIVWGMCL